MHDTVCIVHSAGHSSLEWFGMEQRNSACRIAGLLDVFMLSPTDGWAVGNIAAEVKEPSFTGTGFSGGECPAR